jgi:hypothetical protein
MLLHLKAIFMLVCLKRLMIFLICGDVYGNVVHLVSCLEVVGGGVSVVLVFSLFCALDWGLGFWGNYFCGQYVACFAILHGIVLVGWGG